jgi:tRNA threonylcarbamoyladenosine modification (KEOPS) complex  Pcc1 subunit
VNHYEICHSTGYLSKVAKLICESFDPANLSDRDAFISNEAISTMAAELAKAHGIRVAASTIEHIRAALRIGHDDGDIYRVSANAGEKIAHEIANAADINPLIASFIYPLAQRVGVKPMFVEFFDGTADLLIAGSDYRFNGIYIDQVQTSFFKAGEKQKCLSVIAVNERKRKERTGDVIYNILIPITNDINSDISAAATKNAEYMKNVIGVEYSDQDISSLREFISYVVRLIGFISENKFVRVQPAGRDSIYQKIDGLKNKKKQRRAIRRAMEQDYFSKLEVASGS